MLLIICEFRKNKHKEGHTFLMYVKGITYTRVS